MATGGQLEATSEEYIEHKCTVCLKYNKIENADRYCFDCQKYMCSECLRIHNDFGDRHNVLSVTDKRVQAVLTEKCEDHPDKVLEFYCHQHDVVLCQTCLLDHRGCKDVKHIGESVEDLIGDRDIQAISGHLQSALDHVNQVMEALDKHMEYIREKEDVYLNELEGYIRTILSKIEETKKRRIDDFSHTRQKITIKANEHRKACKDIKADLSKYASEIERSKDRKAHLIILNKKSQAKTRKAESLCKESERMIEDTSLSFILNMALVEELNKCNSLLVEVKNRKFNIRSPQNRSECSVRGCCCLDDGTIMLLDFSNKRLKRLDPVSNTVSDFLSLPEYIKVYELCSIGPQDVAVAAMELVTGTKWKWCIYIYAVGNSTKTNEVTVHQPISCLASHDRDLYVGHQTSLHVYNMAGERKQKISIDSSGRSLFSSIESVTVNKGEDRIYVADRNMGLICLRRDGQEIFRLTNEQLGLSGTKGVTTVLRNQVLICGYNSQNIVQVSKKGRIIGKVLSDIKNPRCLCFDDVRQMLYVAGYMDYILGFDCM